MLTRTLRAVVPAALISAVILGSAAYGDDTHPASGGQTTAHFTDPGAPGFSRLGAECPLPPETPDGCMFTFRGQTHETGDLDGSTGYDGRGGYDRGSNLVRWQVVETFTGTVQGCGTGTLTWRGSGFADLTQLDPTTDTFPLWGSVTIVPGSGTGDLSGISGSFDVDARATFPTMAQTGVLSGPVRCHSASATRP